MLERYLARSCLWTFAQSQLRAASLINFPHLSTFDQTVTDLPGSV
jgi:hypothetical protein